MTKAEMDSCAESNVAVRPPLEIELLGEHVCCWIHVGGYQHGHDLVAVFKPDAVQLHILPYKARFRELHRRYKAEKFLDRQVGSAPVLLQPVTQFRIFRELKNRAAYEMRSSLVTRQQEQEHHRYHLLARYRRAFFFDLDKLGDQALAADFAGMLQTLLQIALNSGHSRYHAHEVEGAGNARRASRPGHEFWPICKWQAEQLADHG